MKYWKKAKTVRLHPMDTKFCEKCFKWIRYHLWIRSDKYQPTFAPPPWLKIAQKVKLKQIRILRGYDNTVANEYGIRWKIWKPYLMAKKCYVRVHLKKFMRWKKKENVILCISLAVIRTALVKFDLKKIGYNLQSSSKLTKAIWISKSCMS